MKRILCIFLTVSVIVSALLLVQNTDTVNAALTEYEYTANIIPEDNDLPDINEYFQVILDSVEGKTGDLVSVPIIFTGVPEAKIRTASMTFKYNPEHLEYFSTAPGPIVPDPDSTFSYNTTSGRFVTVNFEENSENPYCISSDGVFAYITFRVLSKYNFQSKLEVQSTIFKDKELNLLLNYPRHGYINILGNEPYPVLKVKVGSVECHTDDIVTIPVSFSDMYYKSIDSFTILLNYDPSQLEYISYEPGEILGSKICFGVDKNFDGQLTLLYINDILEAFIEKNGVLVNLNFKVLGTSGESDVYISKATIINSNLEREKPVLYAGKVSILPPSSGYNVSGYVYSEYANTNVSSFSFHEGFKVELTGTDYSALTDSTGYFEIKDVPAGTYTLKITKANYLTREIEDFTVEKDEELTNPIILWIGDLEINGKQDGAINMEDLMEICKAFNTASDDALYKEALDFNKDKAINLEDIMIILKHFNKTSANYR